MNKKVLVLLPAIFISFLFLALCAYAKPVTTFDRAIDGSASTTRSDYVFIVGCLPGTDICFPGFDNASLFYTSSSGTPKTNWFRGEYSVNGTRTGSYVEDYFTSGILAPRLTAGYCMDLTYIQMAGTYTTDIGIGFSALKRCSNSAGETCVYADGNQGNVYSLHTGDPNSYTVTTLGVIADVPVNATLVYNASYSKLYMNNSDTHTAVHLETANDKSNFSISITSEHTIGLNLTYFAVYNCSEGAPQVTTPPGSEVTSNYDFTAINSMTGAAISAFNITLYNDTFTLAQGTTNGTIHVLNSSVIFDHNKSVFFYTFEGGGYWNNTFSVTPTDSGSFQAALNPFYYLSLSYTSPQEYEGINYTRTLNYTLNYTCLDKAELLIFTNGTLNASTSLTCGSNRLIASGYTQYKEQTLNVNAWLNASYLPATNNFYTDNKSFTFDLYDPVIRLNFTVPTGFTPAIANITVNCTDTYQYNLTFNLSFNNESLFYGNLTTRKMNNITALRFGNNVAKAACFDFFGQDNVSVERTAFFSTLQLIDEMTNTPFNLDNVSEAKVYYDINRSVYNFKTLNISEVNFTVENDAKLRLELIYLDGSIVNRYIDVELVGADNLRICANKEGISHYQQLIISKSEKVAIVRNLYSDCYIAADYTRFVYQGNKLLQAYSIASLYYLYTFDDDGNQIYLASIDGSLATYIDLDNLEFGLTAFDVSILSDALTFSKSGETTIKIYYDNLAEDNTALQLDITRTDTNTNVFSTTAFSDFNEFTVYFDYSTLSNVTNETLFKMDLQRTNAEGTSTLTKYFNIAASYGFLSQQLAVILAFLLTAFGLTFAIARTTFSWLGIVVQIASIAILSLAVLNWYILLFMAINIIILIYIVLLLVTKYYPTIS